MIVVGIATRHGDRIPVVGQISLTPADRPWGPRIFLRNEYRVSFPGEKRPGRNFGHSPILAPRLKKE